MERDISDTAFLVNESRARRIDLSLDRHARDWIPDDRKNAVSDLWRRYSDQVYAHDDLEVSLRNRHYLRWILEFLVNHPGASVVILGAGLVSYPYLLAYGPHFVEVDLGSLIAFKKQRALELSHSGVLPSRSVIRHACDLNDADQQDALFGKLATVFREGPTCLLMEGLVYYLGPEAYSRLVARIATEQQAGSLLLFDYWTGESIHHSVFRRQTEFFGEEMRFAGDAYHFLSHTDAKLTGYDVLDQGGVREKVDGLGVEIALPPDEELLPEYSVVLRKQ